MTSHDDATFDDDPALDALLRAPPAALPDGGFTAAVMRRVRGEPRAAEVTALDGATALERLRERAQRERRQGHWRLLGAVPGVACAAGAWWLAGGPSLTLLEPQALALLLGLGAMLWALADHALREVG